MSYKDQEMERRDDAQRKTEFNNWKRAWPEGTTFAENYQDLEDAADRGNSKAISLMRIVDEEVKRRNGDAPRMF